MPKILVADDNTNIQKMVVLAFQERGIEVVAVGNGESAVRKLNDVNPDLVLADVFMPVRNGYEVCEFIKKDSRTAHVPVILLVGAFDPLDEKEARRVGADGVLKKPFVPPDPLIAMVMSALEKNPRVAAELAKAKEVAAEPPSPPALEIQAKKEPVPLPNFPDPTPEEAAAIYGFGKGVRGDAEEGEAKSSPLKHKAPGEEDDEEFDGASTQSGWRRAGMDLEIPEEIAGQPSFSTEQDFTAISFPSERDVPPRHVRVEEPAAQVIEFVKPQPEADYEAMIPANEPAAKESSAAAHSELPAKPAPAIAENFEVPQAAEHEPEPASSGEIGWARASETAPALHETAAEVASYVAHEAGEIAEPAASSPVEANATAQDSAAHEEPAAPRPAAHWMDMMSLEASGDYPSSSWQAGFAPTEETSAQASDPISSRGTSETAVEGAEVAEPGSFSEPSGPDRGGFSYHFASSERSEDQPENNSAATSPLEAHFQAGGKIMESAAPEVQEVVCEEVRAVLHERENQVSIPAENTPDANSDVASDARRVSSPRAMQRVFEAESAVPASSSAEAHVVAPYTGSPADAGYAAVPEAHSPLPEKAAEESEADSFFEPEAAAPAYESPSSEEPAEAKSKSLFDTLAARSTERIPTSAPETREDLAGIPFLAPPQPVHGTNGSNETGEKIIDSVVQRVLERLEPQLHDLLTKGVLKPLIENLLQQELEKKDR